MNGRGDYGFDAPNVPIGFAIAAVLACGVAVIFVANSYPWLAYLSSVVAIVFALSTISYVWTTRRGKFIVWGELLDTLALRRDLLDVGCGRGMVLILAAKRLPAGRAIGVDLWSTTDQSGDVAQCRA